MVKQETTNYHPIIHRGRILYTHWCNIRSCLGTKFVERIGFTTLIRSQVWIDNLGAKYLAHNPVFHSHIKHMTINFYFVCELVQLGILQVTHIKENYHKLLELWEIFLFMIDWKVEGALIKPNDMTLNMKCPMCVRKTYLFIYFGLTLIWWYPARRSNLEKIVAPCNSSSNSSKVRMGN